MGATPIPALVLGGKARDCFPSFVWGREQTRCSGSRVHGPPTTGPKRTQPGMASPCRLESWRRVVCVHVLHNPLANGLLHTALEYSICPYLRALRLSPTSSCTHYGTPKAQDGAYHTDMGDTCWASLPIDDHDDRLHLLAINGAKSQKQRLNLNTKPGLLSLSWRKPWIISEPL